MRPLVWFRSDLRVHDNPALDHACAIATDGVVAVFVVSAAQWKEHDWGDARVGFVLETVAALGESLGDIEIPLLILTVDDFEDASDALVQCAQRHACHALLFNRELEVNERERDRAVSERFEEEGLDVRAFTDQTILPPGACRTGKGDFYSVFTPFRKKWTSIVEAQGYGTVLRRPSAAKSIDVEAGTLPTRVSGFSPSAYDAVAERWPAGEAEAMKRLRAFARKGLDEYDDERDRPDLDSTSRLSPYLACGAISVRQCLHAAVEANDGKLAGGGKGAETWISELVWREFYRHVIVGFPRVSKHRAFRPETEKVKWRDDDEGFEAWCAGKTGYPIVDAAMRQLRATGWMHNRLRMVTAMFLTKDLLIDWRRGERHFMQHLLDGDLASNNGGWQWAASTGTDAAPYFRVFNPTSQSEKCDPKGAFIRAWVEELADVEGKSIHDPPADVREARDYPAPVVDHAKGRDRAVKAFEKVK